jgi:hypothetical protein
MPKTFQKNKVKAGLGFRTPDFFKEKTQAFKGLAFRQKIRYTQHKG